MICYLLLISILFSSCRMYIYYYYYLLEYSCLECLVTHFLYIGTYIVRFLIIIFHIIYNLVNVVTIKIIPYILRFVSKLQGY